MRRVIDVTAKHRCEMRLRTEANAERDIGNSRSRGGKQRLRMFDASAQDERMRRGPRGGPEERGKAHRRESACAAEFRQGQTSVDSLIDEVDRDLDTPLIVLLLSGIAIWRRYFSGYLSIDLVRFGALAHAAAAFVVIAAILVHIYAGIWIQGTLEAMLHGWFRSLLKSRNTP